MKAVGVIVEYNPFHNGHALHLAESKQASGADIIIAAMSGNFLQRGEPALVSKWTRAKMALQAGVDIVFELPYQYATQQAEIFAYGGVSLLTAASCDSICFGSESGEINAFHDTYDFLVQHHSEFQANINQYMQNGVSYPKAQALSFQDLVPHTNMVDLSEPNNILGYQYLKAAKNLDANVQMLTVPRKSAGYHDEHFASSTIASATSIRTALFSKNNMDEIAKYVPNTTYELLKDYQQDFGLLHNWEHYWPFLKYKLLSSTPQEITEIYEIEEGIENRLLSYVGEADSFVDFMTRVKTKRYTWTRLQRMCLHILTNTKKSDMQVARQPVPYLRLLGMSEAGREYLRQHKKRFSIPVISKLSAYVGHEIDVDIRAAKLYNMILPIQAKQEFEETPIYLKKEELT